MIEMPAIGKNVINPTWQIDQFTIKPTAIIPEEIEVKINKNSSDYRLSYSII